MWPFKSAGEKLSPEEKKLKDARFYVKWLPYLCVASFAMLAQECCELVKYPSNKHVWGLLSLLYLTLRCFSGWQKSRAYLTNTRCTWTDPAALVTIFVSLIGQWAVVAYRHGDQVLYPVIGTAAILAISSSTWAITSSFKSDKEFNRKARTEAVLPS